MRRESSRMRNFVIARDNTKKSVKATYTFWTMCCIYASTWLCRLACQENYCFRFVTKSMFQFANILVKSLLEKAIDLARVVPYLQIDSCNFLNLFLFFSRRIICRNSHCNFVHYPSENDAAHGFLIWQKVKEEIPESSRKNGGWNVADSRVIKSNGPAQIFPHFFVRFSMRRKERAENTNSKIQMATKEKNQSEIGSWSHNQADLFP